MHGLHWPEAVLSYVVVALALGFPLVVALAWAFDVKAGRIERTGPAPGLGGPRLAAVLAGVGLLAGGPRRAPDPFFQPPSPPPARERGGVGRAGGGSPPPAQSPPAPLRAPSL